MKQILLLGTVLLAFALNANAAPENVVAYVNATAVATDDPATPDNWSAVDVGWFYTPSSTITVTDVGTEFGSSAENDVTVEILSAIPRNGSDLLAKSAATFNPVADTLVFSTLNQAVTLVAGTKYFIGFENVSGVGVNVTSDIGSTSLGSLYYDMTGNGSFTATDANSTDLNSRPILEFADNANGGFVTTPEPSTWALLFGSLAGLAVLRRLRPVRQS
jgi:hypothetical protein